MEDHFDRAPELEQVLRAKGDEERLARIWKPTELATIHYTRQSTPQGLGHAVLCAAPTMSAMSRSRCCSAMTSSTPVDPLLQRMIDVRDRFGGSVVALMQVDSDQVSQYGCAAIEPTETDGVVTADRPGREARPCRRPEQLDRHRALRV